MLSSWGSRKQSASLAYQIVAVGVWLALIVLLSPVNIALAIIMHLSGQKPRRGWVEHFLMRRLLTILLNK